MDHKFLNYGICTAGSSLRLACLCILLAIHGTVGQTKPTLEIRMLPGVLVNGDVGRTYTVEYTGTPEDEKSWLNLTNVLLQTGSAWAVDFSAPSSLKRFYRAVGAEFKAPTNMVYIPAGTFLMGSPTSEKERNTFGDSETQHSVTLSKGFWMGQYEVTQGEYQSVIGSNPSYFKNGQDAYPGGTGGKVTNDVRHPVEEVSWKDATNYCAELTQKDRLAGKIPGDYSYRLPTEAEWEYACRGGTTNAFHFGNAIRQGMANFDTRYEYDSAVGTQYKPATGLIYRTVETGSYAPNAFGLYDMHGNVWEWCSDWYGAYPETAVIDPKGPTSGGHRVLRGGRWNYGGRDCRAAFRHGSHPVNRGNDFGFRLVLSPGQ